MRETLESAYTTVNNDIKLHRFKVDDLIVVHNTISTNRFGERSEYQEIEMGYITKFVKDKHDIWSSFMMKIEIVNGKHQNNKRPYDRIKRVYLLDSDIYSPHRITPLDGKIEDHPEYFL